MQCPQCRHANPPQSKFCLECGARFAARCPGCGTELPGGAKFCNECGRPMAPATAATPRFTSPETYTPRHLAEKILTSRAAMEGERKHVTVLFADLKGSTELLADRDPEDARRIIDPVLERMMDAVHQYDGTVNQVMGDGIMALFGAPVAHEDHAIRACYAALRMQESVRLLADEVHRTEGVPIQMRVGLNSGEVVVRSVGSDLRMDYTAVGQTTHLAARMEQMAMPGSVLLTASTLKLVEGYVTVRPLGPRPVKGLDAPIPVYEALGATSVRSRLEVATARGLTRFVGRDTELELLHQALERARDGHGQIVAVAGEPGVGKSRLYWEFKSSPRTEGWRLLESSSVSYGQVTAYLPVIDVLRRYFEVDSRDDARKVREKITGKVLSLDRALERFLPPLLSLLDVAPEDPLWDRLQPPQRRQRTLEGVKRLLVRESQVQPLIVLFEDLHWMDAETQALLDGVVDSLPTARMLLLVNYRPEYQPSWGRKTYYREIRIDPLPPERAEALLDALLGGDPALDPLKRMLIQRTEGNPFFLEESVRTLVETNVLACEPGAYRLAKTIQTIELPATAQAILAARIDRLSPEDKRVLQAASVVGQKVAFPLLSVIAENDDEQLRQSLEHLQAAEFLYETNLFPELEYTFKHAVTQEVAYGSLPGERRRVYHGQIARALEETFAARLDEKSELLAHHYQLSGNAEKAFVYLVRSAERAAGRFAAEEATRHYEAAIGILARMPATEEREQRKIDLRLAQAQVVWVRGRYAEGRRILEEAQRTAEELGDLTRLAQIHLNLGWYSYDQTELDRGFEHYRECLRLGETLGQLNALRRVYWGLGSSCRALSSDVNERRRCAIGFHRQGLALAEGASPPEFQDVHNAHFLWLIFLFQLGDWEQAMLALERADAFARRLPEGSDALHVALIRGSFGLAQLLRSSGSSHLSLLDESLRAAERAESHIYTTISRYLLGQAHYLLGNLGEARAHFDATRKIAEATGNLFLPGTLLWSAETVARLGALDEAVDRVTSYETLVAKVGSLEGLAWFPSRGVAERVLGLVCTAEGDVESAGAHFARSIATLTEHGYVPDLARSHVAIGEFHASRGESPRARDAYDQAIGHFRKIGFGRELDQTVAAQARL